MRYQGKIFSWKDDRGFGFIAPERGRDQVFVHIKSFENRQRRPVANEIVFYDLKPDLKGRMQAFNVAYAGELTPPAVTAFSHSSVPLILAVAFFGFVTALTVTHKISSYVLFAYAIISLLTIAFYAYDKSRAKSGAWRISERTLHLLSLCGGWPGALMAQKWFCHKSKKQSFRIAFGVTVVVNCVAFFYFSTKISV
jgi:uncharacterized membrane protein YsdA (DUF1294 family)/cold shock CspA family protein